MNTWKKVLYYTIALLIIPISIWSFTHFHLASKASVKGIHADKISKISITPTKTPIPTKTQSVKLSRNFYKKSTPTPIPTIKQPTSISSGSIQATSSNNNTNNQNDNSSTPVQSYSAEPTPTHALDAASTSTQPSSTNQAGVSNQVTPNSHAQQPEVTPTPTEQLKVTPIQPPVPNSSGDILVDSNGVIVNSTSNFSTNKNGNTATVIVLNKIITTPPPVGADSKIVSGAYSESTACVEGQTCQ